MTLDIAISEATEQLAWLMATVASAMLIAMGLTLLSAGLWPCRLALLHGCAQP